MEEEEQSRLPVADRRVLDAYVTTFRSEAGSVVLEHLERVLHHRSTVKLDDFQQGQRSVYAKILSFMEKAELETYLDEIARIQEEAERRR